LNSKILLVALVLGLVSISFLYFYTDTKSYNTLDADDTLASQTLDSSRPLSSSAKPNDLGEVLAQTSDPDLRFEAVKQHMQQNRLTEGELQKLIEFDYEKVRTNESELGTASSFSDK